MNAPHPILCSAFVFLAFVLAGIAQTLWLRCEFSKRFTWPLDGGRTYRMRRIFGENKTWRGFVVMIPATGLSFLIVHLIFEQLGSTSDQLWPLSPGAFVLLGGWAGFGFMLGELPNSFLKRQWDIGPGSAPPNPVARTICFTIDQVDSIVGGLIALWLVVPVPILSWIYILVIGAAIHWAFNLVFMLLGLKARAA